MLGSNPLHCSRSLLLQCMSGPTRLSPLARYFLSVSCPIAFSLILLVPAAAPASPQTAAPASRKTLSQVVDDYTAAVGGKAALDAISSLQITGRPPGAGPLSRTRLILDWKAPSKALETSKSTLTTSQTGYDGKQGWYLPQHGRSHHLTQEKVDLLLLTCNPLRFVHLQEIYPAAALEGQAELDGRAVDVVVAKTWEGERRLSFDSQTHLLLQLEDRLKSGGKPRLTRFSNYKDFGEVKIPAEIEQDPPYGTQPNGIHIEKVHFNVKFKDIQFENPR
jgi:hypothetical protein